jgi:hypothetical protein
LGLGREPKAVAGSVEVSSTSRLVTMNMVWVSSHQGWPVYRCARNGGSH